MKTGLIIALLLILLALATALVAQDECCQHPWEATEYWQLQTVTHQPDIIGPEATNQAGWATMTAEAAVIHTPPPERTPTQEQRDWQPSVVEPSPAAQSTSTPEARRYDPPAPAMHTPTLLERILWMILELAQHK